MAHQADRRASLQTSHSSMTASRSYFATHGTRQAGAQDGFSDDEIGEDVVCPDCQRKMSKLNICVCGKCVLRCCTCPVCGCR